MYRVSYKDNHRVKFFNDRSFGGTDPALAAAVEYRDLAEKELGKPRTDRTVVTRSPRTRTGVVGVRRSTKRAYTKNGDLRVYDVYEVTWSPQPNTLRRTSISISKYGEEEAFRLAQEIRRTKEEEMYQPPRARKRTTKTAAEVEGAE